MSNPIKRLNYYDHEFLRATDFTAEQTYHMSMRRLHNQVLHTWGVAQGLTLALAGTAVTVAPGVAIDSQGREMVINTPTNLDLSNMPLNTTQYVTIAYGEQTSDHTTETGGDGDTRWTEQPVITMAATLPTDTSLSLLLGQITRAQDGSFSLSTSSRVPAAAVTPPDITANSLTLKNSATGQAQWPRLTSVAANQATLNGNLAATGDLSCNNLTAAGNLSGAAANVTGTLTCDHVVQNNPAADLKVANSVSVGTPKTSGSTGSISASGDISGNNLVGAAVNVTGVVTCDHVVQKNPAPGMQQILTGSISGSPAWSGTGDRYFDTTVTFQTPFSNTPVVQASLAKVDMDHGFNSRIELIVDTVSKTGFRLRMHTWADTVVYAATANWIAIL